MPLRPTRRLALGTVAVLALTSVLPQTVAARPRQPAPAVSPVPLATGTPSAVQVTTTPAPLPAPSYVPVSPNAMPSLPSADTESPLPFPYYGTPAPASPPHVDPAVPQVITLQQAILIAYARSPLLAEARAQVAIATAPVALAQSALFPELSATATNTYDHTQAGTSTSINPVTGAPTTSTTGGWSTDRGLSLSLQQLIYDGGHVADEIRSARATQSATIATYQRELQTIAYNVANAYYNVLAAQRQRQVDIATVALDQVQENLVAAQIRAGTEAAADLSTAQLPTEQARVAVIKQQATEKVALATFANTLGIDAAINVQPKDDVPPLSATSGTISLSPAFPTPSYDQAYARANLLRPDLTSAQQTVLSYQWNFRAAKLGNFPTLSLAGGYNIDSTSPGGAAYRNSGSIGLDLDIPIYDRGATRAETAQAQGQLDNAVAQLVAEQQSIQLNVQSALVNLVAAYAALTQTDAELAKAQDVLRSTQAQYKAGVTTLPLLLNAQVGITQALTDEVSAVYAVRQAEQALLYAEGANAAG
ncbi:MAG TPA: TolC family protein [Candidatus Sulfotelmatobacter sp.]|nr:TolC family protein [Candidatus Sulfotelmatobacter sp.]